MALRKIALQGEPCLTKVCRPVTDFNSRLHTLLDDLADTLADSGGVGLAAPQVGVLRRVCVVLDEEDQLIELVNPEIIRTEGEQTGLEGCLSVPGKYGEVTRRKNNTAEYKRLYNAVRAVDKDHIITLECIWTAFALPHKRIAGFENVVYQVHFYQKSDFIFVLFVALTKIYYALPEPKNGAEKGGNE